MRTRKRAWAAAGASVAALTVVWLWWILLSPFGYAPPDGLQPVADGPQRVFVYGTLRFRTVRWIVIGRAGDAVPAELPGYRRERLDVVPDAAARVPGAVIGVTPPELGRLDRYERLGIRYDRVRVELADGTEAWAYRRIIDD